MKIIKLLFSSIILFLSILNCHEKKSDAINNSKKTLTPISTYKKDTVKTFKNYQKIANNIDSGNTKIAINTIEADADFQQEANDKLNKLLNYYGKNIPDYYAGAYIDEKGNLVINIKGELEGAKRKVKNIIGSQNITFKGKKFSHAELTKIMDFLNGFALKPENKKYMKNISGWSLMEIENYVEICFVEMKKDSESDFRKYILDSEALHFKECGRFEYQ